MSALSFTARKLERTEEKLADMERERDLLQHRVDVLERQLSDQIIVLTVLSRLQREFMVSGQRLEGLLDMTTARYHLDSSDIFSIVQ